MATKPLPYTGLPATAVKRIEKQVDNVFDRLRVRLLGPESLGKRIYVNYSRHFSLPGLFEAASREEGAVPNIGALNQVLNAAGGYVEAQRARVKARVVREVSAFLQDAAKVGGETDLKTVLGGKLTEVWSDTASQVRRIINTEATYARNTGVLDGIIRINAAAGIEDSVIYFVVVRDQALCDECKKIHLLPDEKTPRIWRMSEVGSGYHKKGEENPKIGGLHPHCLTGSMMLHTGMGLISMEDLFRTQESPTVVVDARVKNRRVGGNQLGASIPGDVWFHRHASGARLLSATPVYDTGAQECLRITLDSGQKLEVSTGHEMWIDDGKKGTKVRADRLAVGDKVPLISGMGGFGIDRFVDLAELMGNLMGDGTVGVAQWHFFGDDIPYGRVIKEKAFPFMRQAVASLDMKVSPPDQKYNVSHAQFSSVNLGRIFIEEFGLSKAPRRVPKRLWSADAETIAAFLRGLYAADGHSEDIPAVVLAQNDREFLGEIQLLLSMFGLNARIFTHGKGGAKTIEYADGRVFDTNRKPCWRLALGGVEQCKRFAQEIGLGVPAKQRALETRLSLVDSKRRHGAWRTALVKQIEPLGLQQTYCLTEPLTNTITVNGIVTGQCRCSIVTLMPGYGFNAAGFVTYIAKGHDELAKQRA